MILRVPLDIEKFCLHYGCRVDISTWEASSEYLRSMMRSRVRETLAAYLASVKVEVTEHLDYVDLRADVYVFAPADLFALIKRIRDEATSRPVKYVDPASPVEDAF